MKRTTLDLLVCPICHGGLDNFCTDVNADPCLTGNLYCPTCTTNYSIVDGIPHFILPGQLTGLNQRFSRLYDGFSWGYSAFSKIAFSYIGMNEETARRQITDRLDPRGGRVLEVSIGPGVNLPYLFSRADVGQVYGLDISPGQLMRCQNYVRKKSWNVELFLGTGEQLPYRNDTFDGVLHVGGINFFNDKKAAIDEMIRVARPGARILIADETEKGAQAYDKFFPGFKKSFGGKRSEVGSLSELIPSEMLDLQVSEIWKGWFFCVEFMKPERYDR